MVICDWLKTHLICTTLSMSDANYIFISRPMQNSSLVQKYIFPLASNQITSNDVFDELHKLSTTLTTVDLFVKIDLDNEQILCCDFLKASMIPQNELIAATDLDKMSRVKFWLELYGGAASG